MTSRETVHPTRGQLDNIMINCAFQFFPATLLSHGFVHELRKHKVWSPDLKPFDFCLFLHMFPR